MRSLRWVVAVILAVGVAAGLAGHSTGSVHSGSPHSREVLFTYQARLTQLPQQADTIDVWIPLAKTTREQQILSRQVHVSAPYAITQDPDYGNDILHAAFEPPMPGQLELVIEYRVRLFGDDSALVDPPPTREELQRSLQPSGLVIVDDEVRTRAVRATAGRATPMDKARGIYEAVIQQVKYDKSVPGWGRGDTRRVCLLGVGNCTDFHSLFISMARAQRVPARFKIGVVVPQEASGAIPGYHCWAEFYVEGRGWVPVDASEAWKHPELVDDYFGARDPNRLLVSLGRDIRLVPKSQNGPINMFFYPYVEVDGEAFDGAETQLTFRELNQEEAG